MNVNLCMPYRLQHFTNKTNTDLILIALSTIKMRHSFADVKMHCLTRPQHELQDSRNERFIYSYPFAGLGANIKFSFSTKTITVEHILSGSMFFFFSSLTILALMKIDISYNYCVKYRSHCISTKCNYSIETIFIQKCFHRILLSTNRLNLKTLAFAIQEFFLPLNESAMRSYFFFFFHYFIWCDFKRKTQAYEQWTHKRSQKN